MRLVMQRVPLFVFLLGILLLLNCSTTRVWAELPTQVQVRLFEAHPGIRHVRLQGAMQVLAPMQRTLPDASYQVSVLHGQLAFRPDSSKTNLFVSPRLRLKALSRSIAIQPDGLQSRRYSGNLELTVTTTGEVGIANRLPARTYVAVVVSSETLPGWPTEALKAQAVLTQTGLSRYRPGDALGDSTQKEVFLGLGHLRPEATAAVNAVWGQTLVYRNRPITPFYHASCGGHTSDGRFLNPTRPIPWLSSVRCPYCRLAPFSKPTTTVVERSAWDAAFSSATPKIVRPEITRPEIIRIDSAGRPLTVQLAPGKTRSGYQFWLALGRRLGWDKAPGTRFSLRALPGGNMEITSTGAGHGVGLCQWGAAEMARQGKTYAQILQFYFPKTQLHRSEQRETP